MNKFLLLLTVSLFGISRYASALSSTEVETYLKENPTFLEEYLVKNPETILKHTQDGKLKNKETHLRSQKKLDDIISQNNNKKSDLTEYTLGNPNGTFIIKAFYDYQCGWCRRSNEALNNMLQSDKAKNIKIVLMPNPIFGEKSELITKYVLASANQGKLTEMHNAVFNKAPQDENILIDIAKSLGMDTQRLKEDAYSAQIKTKLQKNQQMARQLNLQGVPAFVINGELHTGAILDEKAEEILKMQDSFIPAVIPNSVEVEDTVPEKRPVTVYTENEKETNFTVSPEANKLIVRNTFNEYYSTSFALTGSTELHVGKGRRISVFSPDSTLRISSRGLRWPLDGVVFDNWWKATLNIASEDVVELGFDHPSMALVILD